MEFLRNIDGPRLVRPGEQRASNWLSQLCFSSEPPGDPPAIETDSLETALSDGTELDETYAMFHNGIPVSQITIVWEDLFLYGQKVTAGFIGGVCTHPEYREKRLAGVLLDFCAKRLRDRGARVMIVSGGRGLYRRAGCVPMGRFANITLRPQPDAFRNSQFVLRVVSWGDLSACSRAYSAEPARFARPLERFLPLLKHEEMGYQAERYVVELDGEVVAYFLLNTPWDFMGVPGAGVRCIFEYGGSKLALAAGLYQAVNQLNLRELQAPIPWQDVDLWSALQQGTLSWAGLPDHTIRILDFPGMMEDLRPYWQALLPSSLCYDLRFEQAGPLLAGQGGDTYTIRRDDGTLTLDGAAMTSIVFGAPDSQMEVGNPGILADVVRALFPLPSFFTGLDYH